MSSRCCEVESSYVKKKSIMVYYIGYFTLVLNIYVFSYSPLPYLSAYGIGHLKRKL